QALGTILDDDLPSLSVNDVTISEGNTGTRFATFTVSLSPTPTKTVTVNYATADGTATSPGDYQSAAGTLTFAPGQTTKTITVQVKGDTRAEGDETFFVNLSGAVNALIQDGQGLGVIRNDDSPRR